MTQSHNIEIIRMMSYLSSAQQILAQDAFLCPCLYCTDYFGIGPSASLYFFYHTPFFWTTPTLSFVLLCAWIHIVWSPSHLTAPSCVSTCVAYIEDILLLQFYQYFLIIFCIWCLFVQVYIVKGQWQDRLFFIISVLNIFLACYYITYTYSVYLIIQNNGRNDCIFDLYM